MIPFKLGSYRGTGEWMDQKAQGGYTVECAMREGPEESMVQTVKRLFPVPEGSTVYGQPSGIYEERSTVTFVPGRKNEFRVTIESEKGSVHGTGYFFRGQCHYDVAVAPGVHVEFTLTVSEGRIEGLGSSSNKGNFTSWRETLEAAD